MHKSKTFLASWERIRKTAVNNNKKGYLATEPSSLKDKDDIVGHKGASKFQVYCCNWNVMNMNLLQEINIYLVLIVLGPTDTDQ